MNLAAFEISFLTTSARLFASFYFFEIRLIYVCTFDYKGLVCEVEMVGMLAYD